MSDLDLDLLREWSPASPPSDEVRADARAQLEAQYGAVEPVRNRGGFGRRFVVAAVAATLLVAVAVFAIQRAVDDRVGQVKTVGVPEDVLGGGEIGKDPVNILVVGSDARDGSNPEAFGTPAETGPPKSDTMFVLRVDGSYVQAMWFPRDLIVGTPGQLINSTFNNGPQGLIDAVRTEFGITVDHYVEIDFRGFVKAVDALGGVTISSPGRARDKFSGLDLAGPGCVKLDGDRALQWVRSRHLEIFRDGQWADGSPSADLDRISRQQEFFRAFAVRATSQVDGDPVAAVRLVDALLPALIVDERFDKAQILGLVRLLIDVDPHEFVLATLPVRPSADGAHLVLNKSGADVALAPFRGGPPTKIESPVGPAPTVATVPVC